MVIERIDLEQQESPTVEVRVWRRGQVIHRELCDSLEVAAEVMDDWLELEGTTCEAKDLGAPARRDADW